MNIKEKLLAVQSELKAPKGQENTFGGFKYRSCEDILEAVKPLLTQNGATLKIADEIVLVGDRYYVKATAIFSDTETDEGITVTAYAREEQAKKGMDSAQVTGATSSYARKYALNGLFLIDDTKDPDTDAHTKERKRAEKAEETAKDEAMAEEAKDKMIDANKAEALRAKLAAKGVDEQVICSNYGVFMIDAMSVKQWHNAMRRLDKTPDRNQVNLNL